MSMFHVAAQRRPVSRAGALLLLALTSGSALANTPPTISASSAGTIFEDQPVGIGFTVGDAETPAADLTVTVTSNRQSLFTNASLAAGLDVDGAQRFLQLVPVRNATGTATLTLTVVDGDGASSSQPLMITLLPVNDPPTMAPGTSRVHSSGSNGQFDAYGFVSAISAGPDDESGQWVDFETTVESDPDGILWNATLNQNGDLGYELSGGDGEAVLRVAAVDDGGDANGGNNRSLPHRVHIAVGTGVDLVVKVSREVSFASRGASNAAGYRIDVLNNGPVDVSGVHLRAQVRYGLQGASWTCTVPDSVCSVDQGSGDVHVSVDLPVGVAATVNLTGSINATRHFLRIDAETDPPPGMPRLLAFDDRTVFIEAVDEFGLFKDGLE